MTVDGTGNTALGNDTQKLLDAGNTPTFGNAQELAEDFAFLLELNPSIIDARYVNQELLFDLTNIDVADGTAEYLGTAGRAFVTAVLSGWSLYFVENSVGQLNVTTVFAQEAAPKRLKAVHSRHGYLQMTVGRYIAEPSVSQNYGDCEIVE